MNLGILTYCDLPNQFLDKELKPLLVNIHMINSNNKKEVKAYAEKQGISFLFYDLNHSGSQNQQKIRDSNIIIESGFILILKPDSKDVTELEGFCKINQKPYLTITI